MKLALIGGGPRGQAFAAAAAESTLDVTLCAGPSLAAARRLAAPFKAKATVHPLDAIEHAEAMVFTDPSSLDAGPALRALRAGVAVYWAAPLAADPKLARRLLDAAKSARVAFLPDYLGRTCPQYAAAAGQVTANAIGPVGFVRINRHALFGHPQQNGAAFTSLVHDLDWTSALFGPVSTVFAKIVRTKPVDCAMLTLTFANGPIVQCVASAVNPPNHAHASVELCGERGMIQFDTHAPILTLDTHSAATADQPRHASPIVPSLDARRLARFVDAASGAMPPSFFKHEMHLIRLVEAAIQSARESRLVKV